MFLFHIIFLMIFLGVYGGRAMIWVGVNQAQNTLVGAQARIDAQADILRYTDTLTTIQLQTRLSQFWQELSLDRDALDDAWEIVEQGLAQSQLRYEAEAMERFAAAIGKIGKCLQSECQDEQSVWRVLLRLEEGYLPFLLAVALILYNVLRGGLTYWISLLRDTEERTDRSPRFDDYKLWYKAHRRIMRPLVIIAVAARAYNAYMILFDTTVVLPVPDAKETTLSFLVLEQETAAHS